MSPLRPLLAAFALAFTLSAQDRMPPIPADKRTPEQERAIKLLQATPRGNNGTGPFAALLRSPEFMNRLQNVGEYLRYNNTLPQKLVEMTILMTARQWTQQYEWSIHYPLAIKAGISQEVADAIAAGRRPSAMPEDVEMVWDFNNELATNKSVSDPTYARIMQKWGEKGVIDLTGVNGYYTTLAMLMSVARTPGSPTSTAPALGLYTH